MNDNNRPSTPKATMQQNQYQDGEFDRENNDQNLNQNNQQMQRNFSSKQNLNRKQEGAFQLVPSVNNGFYKQSMHKAPWNERFFLSSVQNNARSYPFFKEYFDKPQRQKQDILIKPDKPDIPIEDFYRSSSLAQLLFNSSKKGKKLKRREIITQNQRQSIDQRPFTQGGTATQFNQSQKRSRHSQSQKNLLINEFNWIDNFNIMSSKNNIQVHKNYQEYFDRPIDYDARGYLYSGKMEPMTVYNNQTPIFSTLISCQKPQSSQEAMRQVRTQNSQQRKIQTAQSPTREVGMDAYENQQQVMRKSGSTNFVQTMSSKSTAASHRIKQLHNKNWNTRIGLPISTYNEKVYPRYKIMFENL